jgi:SAM-dependent methyltransferase
MSVFYRAAYRLGFKPWERAAQHRPAAEAVGALFDREQQGRDPPYGRALDLGCGSGHWTVEMAERGWDVTGIDIVPQAIEQARRRVARSGADVRLIQGDATELRAAGVGDGFRLVWDFGTFHGLTPAQREKAGRELSAVTAADATVLMLAWKPGRRGPLPRGVSPADIEAAFAGWRIVERQPFDATGLPAPLRGVEPQSFRLRRV